MKKIYIAMAVLAAAALTSCVREKTFNNVKIGANDVVFSFQGAASTRSSEGFNQIQKGVKMELEANEDGRKLFLEETIEDLDFAPATKGTPAYTQNVGILYKNNLGVYAAGDFGDAIFSNMDESTYGTSGGWRYNHTYDSDPWPDEGSAVFFYLRMPADMTSNGVTLDPDTPYASDGTIKFSYISPRTARGQQDILFASRSLTKNQHNGFLPDGAPVLFNHALTAVKFAIANHDTDEKISIKSISFTGLIGEGTCEVKSATENNYKDYPTTEYSSASSTYVKWTLPDNPSRTATYSSGEYADTVFFAPGGSFQDKSGNSNGSYPSSFSDAGNKQNLNDSLATQTFWFIPQVITNDVKLTIVYTFGSDEERTGELDFGTALNGMEWKAGQLRTYTIRVDEVNVKIEDTITLVNESQEYKDSKKENVVITNTGNTDAYIRAAIIGQWLDENGNPVFGFTDFTNQRIVLVDSWYQDQFGSNPEYSHGEFAGLVGYKNTSSAWWIKGNDGYYYFRYVVPAGKAVPSQDTADTPDAEKTKYLYVTSNGTTEKTGGAPLFTSYTIKDAPDVVVGGQKNSIYFELEVATQAISAKQPDGSYYTLSEAWAKAGITISE